MTITTPKLLISAIIVTILGIQFVMGLVSGGPAPWPMVAYPMYKKPHFDGDRLDHATSIYAVFEDQERIQITPENIGVEGFWIFEKNVVFPVIHKTEKLAAVAELACGLHDAKLARLEAEDKGIAISRNGPVEVEPEVFASQDVSC